MFPLIIVVFSSITRFLHFGYPSQVVFDEVHSGNFITNYWHGTYFFDVHPPFSKLILLFFSHLIGAVPDADFTTIGNALPHSYILMRLLLVILGTLLPLVIYFLCRKLNLSKAVSLLAGLLVVFENSLLVQSRFVLFDIFLVFFGFLSLLVYLYYKDFEIHRKYTRLALLLLSAFLSAAAFGTKWTGLAFAFIIIVLEFVNTFFGKSATNIGGNKFWSRQKWFRFIRFKIVFIGTILVVYVLTFFIHFSLLPNTGTGDVFMSSRFQNTLAGNKLPKPFGFVDGKLTPTDPMNFAEKFVELNVEMYKSNVTFNATHPYSSKWYTWPLMIRSIYYWKGSDAYIYLLGNPLVYWLGTLSIALILVYSLWFIGKKFIRNESYRHDSLDTGGSASNHSNYKALFFIVLGFLINFLPFIFIGRLMFLYHYEPALIFSIMAIAFIVDQIKSARMKNYVVSVLVFLAVVFFLYFSPLTYGTHLDESGLAYRMWFDSWK